MKKSQKQVLAVGAGVAALAAAAAGVYFMTGKNAKNRKKVATWMKDMQTEVVEQLQRAKKSSQAAYHDAVNAVAKNYKRLKKVSGPELAIAAAELKDSWQMIKKEMGKVQKTVRKVTPKSVKKIAKKAVTKKKTARR